MQEVEIKIMPYVWYNQIQAFNFWLNHTQWIIMNYFSYWLPHFWESTISEWKTYFWASINKPLSDMPTLSLKEDTFRNNIRELINKWLLERIIVNVKWIDRAYYRVTDLWLLQSTFTYPSDFNTLFEIVKSNIENWKIKENEIIRLKDLISEKQKVKKVKKITTYNFDWLENWWPIIKLLIEEFKLSEKWEWAEILVWEEINEKYIQENIIDYILMIWEKRWWLEKDKDWNITKKCLWKIELKLRTLFDWHKKNNKSINSFKLKINTFFNKDWI